MKRQKTNKRKYKQDNGLNLLLVLILRRALPVWDQFQGAVPPNLLEQLEKEGDWPQGFAAAAMERLSRDKKLRQQLREP